MCVAFGADGVTYGGTADGHIYRFAEQTMDLAVKAHGQGREPCKVTAMWCNPRTGLLVSSGDDGLLHLWQPASWGGRSAPAPLRTIDMNKWVSADLRGPPLRSMLGVPPPCPCHSALPWPPGAGSLTAWLRCALGTSHQAAHGLVEGCGAAVRPGRGRRYRGSRPPSN